MNYVRSHLSVKLFLSFLVVILIGMLVLGVTSRYSARSAFRHHLGLIEQQFGAGGMTPALAPGASVGQGSGMGPQMMDDLYVNYQASFTDALWVAVAGATGAALIASLLLSRGIVAPLKNMMSGSP